MFSVDFLNKLREEELAQIAALIPLGSKILEIGGGTGVQAAALARMGHSVVSVDVQTSPYRDSRIFPIIDYDGHVLPFPAGSFDIIVSSNVLEHIPDLESALSEFSRVLVPGGYQLHLMPTAIWRFWTIVTGYLELLSRTTDLVWKTVPEIVSRHAASAIVSAVKQVLRIGYSYGIPRRHGEHGTALMELYLFSRRAWMRLFRSQGFTVEEAQAGGIFYTGYMWFGERLPLAQRRKLAGILGSACVLYRIRRARTAS